MGRLGLRFTQKSVVFLILFLLIIIPSLHEEELNQSKLIKSSVDHPKIRFDNNADIALFPNKTGSGTAEDPYVICDLEIDAERNGNPIVLFDIDVYVILRNLTVRNGQLEGNHNYYGIMLEYCSNIVVTECNVLDNSWGINLYNSIDCNVYQNFFFGNEIGVIGFTIENVNISFNYCTNNYCGIHVQGTTVPNYVHNNTIIDNTEGICLEGGAQYVEVSSNYITRCTKGILAMGFPPFSFEDFIQIKENIIYDNQIGIEFSNTDKNTVSRNIISHNSIGVKLTESSYNSFSRNTFENNQLDLDEINSHHNGLIVPMSWQMIVLWSLLGLVGVSSISLMVILISSIGLSIMKYEYRYNIYNVRMNTRYW